MLEKVFKLKELGTNVKTEVLSGITTFMTMSYILFVNPNILKDAGVPVGGALTATALGAGIMTILMGLYTNYPLALASGMGLNAMVAYNFSLQMGLSWQGAMGIIFLEGTIIFLLVLTGFREAVMSAIPMSLKQAIGVGIGLFIAFIGLVNGGIIVANPVTLVQLGQLKTLPILITCIGLVLTAILIDKNIKGSLLLGIILTTIMAIFINWLSGWKIFTNAAMIPAKFLDIPDFKTVLKLNPIEVFQKLSFMAAILAIFSVMLSDFFDTMGTVIAVGGEGKLLDSDGRLPRIGRVLQVDSFAAALGGILGCSSITTYIESASGVSQGGRSGLVAVTCGIMFLLSIFLAPLASVVPTQATAPALVIVGFLMMKVAREIPWDKFEEALPAFLTLLVMPLTYSIINGIGVGFVVYTLMKILSGKTKELHLLMYVVSLGFIIYFLTPLFTNIFHI